MLIDQPVQVFLALAQKTNGKEARKWTIDQISNSEFDGNLRLTLFPEARNQVLIRVENIADLFDG